MVVFPLPIIDSLCNEISHIAGRAKVIAGYGLQGLTPTAKGKGISRSYIDHGITATYPLDKIRRRRTK